MDKYEAFRDRLEKLTRGELPVDQDWNEFVGHSHVIRQLLEVAPDEIREDMEWLADTYSKPIIDDGKGVFTTFASLIDPNLAGVEGRIAEFIAEKYGYRLDDEEWVVGKLPALSNCPGWPQICSPLTNNRWPYTIDTSAGNYFANRFWCAEEEALVPRGFEWVPPGGRVVFKGEYMYARYFAFHPCDFDTNYLDTLVDVDLDPDPGSANPFRGPMPEGMGRRYTCQLVFTPPPDDPEPNTSYVGVKRDGSYNRSAYCTLRIAGADMGALPPNSAGVLLPSVTILDADGNEVKHHPEIDPYPDDYDPPVDTTRFPALQVPDYRGIFNAGKMDTKHNWGMPNDILASRDYLYIEAPFSHVHGELYVARAKAFTTPKTPEEPVYTPGKQIRSWTINTYNMFAGVSRAAKIDYEIALDDDGYYTIVVSRKQDLPKNATPENGVTWIDWGPYLDGWLCFRFLMGRDRLLQLVKKAIDTGETAPEIAEYVPQVGHCSIDEFEQHGWKAAIPQRPYTLAGQG